MHTLSFVIISVFAALGLILLAVLLFELLFCRELSRAVLIMPVSGRDAPIGELLAALRFWSRCRILAVDMSGRAQDMQKYVSAGMCDAFCTRDDAPRLLSQMLAAADKKVE